MYSKAVVVVASHELEGAADRDTNSQASLSLGLNACLQVGVASKDIKYKLRWQPRGHLDSVRMPPLHGLEGEGCAAAEHDVLAPSAARVHTGQKA